MSSIFPLPVTGPARDVLVPAARAQYDWELQPFRNHFRTQGTAMDAQTTTVIRLDPAEPTKRPRTLDQFTDAEIQAADGVVLVDPQHPDWQELLYSAPIGDGALTSMTLQITEIAVDRHNREQVRAAQQRVRRIKSGRAT